MQVIASPRAPRAPILAALVSVLAGGVLVAGGLFLGWLAYTTPLVSHLAPSAIRPTLPQMALGGFVWGVALVVPPACLLVGGWRLSRVVRAFTARPGVRALTRAATELGDDYVAASEVRLPEGRIIHDLVVGPFGMAVLTELPPRRYVRRTGSTWEVRGRNGRWIHMENPLERAARDAERVRRWFAATERDYVVKVFAAIVSDDPAIARTPACAAITADQVPGWLASLPPSRAITADRRAEIVEQVSELL